LISRAVGNTDLHTDAIRFGVVSASAVGVRFMAPLEQRIRWLEIRFASAYPKRGSLNR
jgi:hypothetical protein